MVYRLLADALVVFHFAFVAFVLLGGFVAVRWPRVAFAHLPAAAWGVFVEWSGWLCPLTPLENRLRERGGAEAYQGGFVDHYIMPVLYPAGLTRDMQFRLGAGILLINLTLYGIVIARYRHRRMVRRSLAARAAIQHDASDLPAVGGNGNVLVLAPEPPSAPLAGRNFPSAGA